MKNKIRIIIYAVIVLTAYIVGYNCSRKGSVIIQGKDTTIIKHRTIRDTIKNIVVRWKTATDTIDNSDTISLVVLDSSSCLRIANDYYSKKVYNDTLVDDDFITIYAIDTVYMNKLEETTMHYFIKPKVIPINESKPYLSIGASSSLDFGSINVICGYTRKKLTYLGQYDLRRNVIGMGIIYNIKK